MRRRGNLIVAALTTAALTIAVLVSPSGAQDAKARYAALEDLPTTASSVEELEATAVELADDLDAVLVTDPVRKCEPEKLRVVWEEPQGYELGTVIEPVGPAPGPDTEQVNGAVVCEGSKHQFMGFEAYRQGDEWHLAASPVFDESVEPTGHRPEGSERDLDLDALGSLAGDLELSNLGPIDPYAPYQPQRLCDPQPKPATVALAQLLLETYQATANWGIARDCDAPGISEHKEGRAFDWGASVDDPHERVAVEHMLLRLLSTDSEGNQHALARRMGVMYIIWDRQIWSSFRAEEGWRPYGGPSAHRDHVHISLSWDGAMGDTSLWRAADLGPFLWDLVAPAADGDLPGPSVLVASDPFGGGQPDIGATYDPSRDRSGQDADAGQSDDSTQQPSDDPSRDGDGDDELLPTELPTDELTEPLPDLSTESPLPTESPTLDPSELLSPSDLLSPSPSLSDTLDDTTSDLLSP